MKIGTPVKVTSKKDRSEFIGKYIRDKPLGYLGKMHGKLIETSDGEITLVREDFFEIEEITLEAKQQILKEAFNYLADWSAGETHKRQYSREELKKLSESLMLLHEFFEKYEEEER